MRILFNASRDLNHPNAGGSEVYVDHVIQGLHQRGHKVHLSVGRPVGNHSYGASGSGGTFTQYLRSPLKTYRLRKHFDLVVDVANGMTYYSPLFRSGPTMCLVHHIHTEMWAEWFSPPVAAFGRFLESHVTPRVYRNSQFVTVSDSTKEELQRLGTAEDQIRIAHNATSVPTEPVATTDESPLFVAVGRLVPHKQLHMLLERWPEVHAATGGQLVIIGEGPERKRLEALLTPGASLAGRLSLEERDRMMARATALVHPSYVEGWGLVVMEAAAQGTPSIGFDVPGVRDSIVDGSTGWLCDDIDHFVKTWISSAHEPLMQTDAADRARARALHFGVERTVDAFEAAAFEAVALHEAKSAKGALINIRS